MFPVSYLPFLFLKWLFQQFLGGLAVKGSGVIIAVAQVTAAVQVWSLAWGLPHPMGMPPKRNRLTTLLPGPTHVNKPCAAKIEHSLTPPCSKWCAKAVVYITAFNPQNPARSKLLSPLFIRLTWGTKTKMAWDHSVIMCHEKTTTHEIFLQSPCIQLLPQNGFSQLSTDCEAENKSSMWLQFSQSLVCCNLSWFCPFIELFWNFYYNPHRELSSHAWNQ